MNAIVQQSRARLRFPLLALGMLALLAAMWGGLLRQGWSFPPLAPALTGVHGPLMISGFLGTLISLERAVALQQRWAYLAPALTALGALLLISGISTLAGALANTLGSLGLVAIFGVIVRRHPAPYTYTMGLGTLAWFVGNLLWLVGLPISQVVQWWSGFLVLTIVGERLELARVLRPSFTSQLLFALAIGVLVLGLAADTIESLAASNLNLGFRIAGAGMFAIALWLFRYDIARRTVRQSGLTRFIGACLLLGYGWLAIDGLLRLGSADRVMAGPYYDATLHTLFLGFVMSMIFGHAPIILPAVLGRPMPFHPSFYLHLALLHLSLVLRIIGDVSAALTLRQWGGLLNAVAILLFLAATGRAIFLGQREQARQGQMAKEPVG